MNTGMLRTIGGLLALGILAVLPVGSARAGEADPDDVNALLKQMIQDLARVKSENETLQAKLAAAEQQAQALAFQKQELDENNRRLRAVLRDLAQRGFPVYEVLGKTETAPRIATLPPEVLHRIDQLLEVLADVEPPREGHREDWDWSEPAQAAREELVKLGASALEPLLTLALKTANPVVKMRVGVIVIGIRQTAQAMVNSKVLDVGDRGDLVSIGLGERQGVGIGQVFLLLNGNNYVGQAKVIRVWGDLCVAQGIDRLTAPKVGDVAVALIVRQPAAPEKPATPESEGAPAVVAPKGLPVLPTPVPDPASMPVPVPADPGQPLLPQPVAP